MINQATAARPINLGMFTGLGAPVLLLLMLMMMMLPLPPLLLDLVFTFNIALAMIVLLAAVYALRPLDGHELVQRRLRRRPLSAKYFSVSLPENLPLSEILNCTPF